MIGNLQKKNIFVNFDNMFCNFQKMIILMKLLGEKITTKKIKAAKTVKICDEHNLF